VPLLWVVWQAAPQHDGVAHSHPSVSGVVPLLQSEAPALQVYEHVVPLQLAADALVVVHLSPQALQLLVVSSSVHVPLHSVSVHEHEPLTQKGVGCAQVAWFVQVPVALHVCGVLPLQSVWPGAHVPEHAPATQVWLVHADGAPQAPVLVHASTELPEHCVWLGAHTPEQAPPLHVWFTHATGEPQAPAALHVCTPLPEHCTAPGEHDPVQAPLLHAEFVQATAPPHAPLELQVCTPLPLHWV
jgi:hypothetical protein